MLQHRLYKDIRQIKAQDIPLEKYIWRNVNLRSINMRIDVGRQYLIDIDLMSLLVKKKKKKARM